MKFNVVQIIVSLPVLLVLVVVLTISLVNWMFSTLIFQAQYERWQPRARYKQCLDPTLDDVKKLCLSLRRNAKDDRILFHYNGHGVPRPTENGEIWVFNTVSIKWSLNLFLGHFYALCRTLDYCYGLLGKFNFNLYYLYVSRPGLAFFNII